MASSYISIPTKQGDDNDDEKKRPTAKHHVVEDSSSSEQQQDAFSRYSNDLYRMKALLLLSDDDEGGDDDDLDALATINRAFRSLGMNNELNQQDQGQDNVAAAGGGGDASKRRRGNSSRPIPQGNVRKTRLSWELHPSLLLHDLILELDALDNGVQHVSDDEDEEE